MSTTTIRDSKFGSVWSLARWGAAVLLLVGTGCASTSTTHSANTAQGEGSSALDYYSGKCDAGDANACANAARVLTSPTTAHHDDALALQYRTRACKANAYYCGDLGQMYLSGQGVQRDAPQALSYLDRGCAAKNKDACGAATAARQREGLDGEKAKGPAPAAPTVSQPKPAETSSATPAASTTKTTKKSNKKPSKKNKHAAK